MSGFRSWPLAIVALLRRSARRLRREERGAALVETTLLMPFLLVTCAGVFEFGNMFYQKLLVEAGVRDAARYLARCPTVIGTPGFPCSEDIAKEIAVYGAPGGSTPRVAGWDEDDVTVLPPRETPNPGFVLYRGNDPILTIRVSASFTYDGGGLLDFIGFDDITLSALHEERYIGW
jgi:Flp pilus assembly pilin Flp